MSLNPMLALNERITGALNNIKRSGSTSIRAGLDPVQGSPVGDRQEALKEKLGEYNQFGKRATNLFNQAVDKQKQLKAEAEARRQAEEARKREKMLRTAQSVTGKLSGSVPFVSGGKPDFSNVGGTRGKLLNYASGMIGTPYAWGGGGYGIKSSRGIGKGTQNVIGVDCSGLTSYVYGLIGVKLPRKSDAQLYQGVRTSISNARPGDLIGWKRGGHVAIYAGNGMMIESPKPGGHVRYRSIWDAGNAFAVRVQLPGD